MSPNLLKTSVRVAILQFVLGTALLCSPDWVTIAVRDSVVDAAAPGLSMLRTLTKQRHHLTTLLAGLSDRHTEHAELVSKAHALSGRVNRLTVLNLELQRRLEDSERRHGSPIVASPSHPLIVPELIEAAVIGRELAEQWRSGRFINRGSAHGVIESEWVLRDDKPLIDQGEDSGLRAGQPVYSGRSIVGRISRVGHWSSTVQPVTDPAFRSLARLVHESQSGIQSGPEGILHGTGQGLCQLKFVDSEAPVSEGDGVYTGDPDGLLPFPMYFGRVETAELKPGAPHWDIWIRPDVDCGELLTVQVLRRIVNPVRIAEKQNATGSR